MTRNEALSDALALAQRSVGGDSTKLTAARAFYVILWLREINWNGEAGNIEDRTLATPRAADHFRKIECDYQLARKYGRIIETFNTVFGWKYETDRWRAVRGPRLAEKLWEIITTLPTDEWSNTPIVDGSNL